MSLKTVYPALPANEKGQPTHLKLDNTSAPMKLSVRLKGNMHACFCVPVFACISLL